MPESLTLDYWYGQIPSLHSLGTGGSVCSIALAIWIIICRWKMFEKAGLPWWGSLIPFYNLYLRLKMAGRSWRRLLWLLFPPIFIIIMIVTFFDVAKRFGKSGWFWLWLWFFNPIFIGILAFDKSKYSKK